MAIATRRATPTSGLVCSPDLISETIRPDFGLASSDTTWWSTEDCVAIKRAPTCLLELLSFHGQDKLNQHESCTVAVSPPPTELAILRMPHTAATPCTRTSLPRETL